MTASDTTTAPAPTGESEPGHLSPLKRGRRVAAAAWRRVPRGTTLLVGAFEHLVLAGLAYIPLVLVKPGVETSDTKTYLYLDPGRFLRQVASMWDPTVGLGTVTHQYLGYLLPMGPFYWFFSVCGVPVWVVQRMWLGTLLFAAGAGVLYLCRTLNVAAPGRTVAALAFMLSPYFLQYAGRISVILLPWAGLPFMLAITVRALRQRGWRYPAMFALVVALVSGINATAVLYVAVGPILWILFAVFVLREVRLRTAANVAFKMTYLTVLCCLWWIVGLEVEAGYGVDVLRYTETLKATTSTSNPADVLRGLGYWYFYGRDRLAIWTESAVLYTQHAWVVALSYVAPMLAFVGAIVTRWRYRAFFIVLTLVGMVLSVGAYPYTNPTPIGSLLKAFMLDTTAGLALRSTDRATPLVVLSLAMLLGSGVAALRLRTPRTSLLVGLLAAGVVVAANPAIFNGDAEVASFFTQPAKLPAYQMAAIKHLNDSHQGTRVLAIPGETFSAFRWGDTVDPPQPAFLTRPFVTHEQQIMGSIPTANTLSALDDPIENGIEQWASLAPMARLLSAGDVLVQYDQAYEHYNSPEPDLLAEQLASTPAGLSDPVSFGTPRANVPAYKDIENADLINLGPLPNPAPLVDYTVSDPRPITRAESDSGALVVAGDANGLENLAAAGLLDTDSAIYYSATLDHSPGELDQLLADGAALAVTDTNRKEAFRWDTFIGDYGYTETPQDDPAKTDLSDSPIVIAPGSPLDSKTIATYLGAMDVTASSYGNTDSYTPEDDAYQAIDGDLDTAWTTGIGLPDPAGQWWQLQLGRPVSDDQVTLVQPQSGNTSRSITKVTLSFDGRDPVTVTLGPASLLPAGQVVTFPERTFKTLRITIDRTTDDHQQVADSTAVGFAEVGLPGVHVTEVIKMPSDLLAAAGARSLDNRLTIDMTRERVAPTTFPYRTDPETTIAREFTLPTARTFSLSGTASLSSLVPDDEIDRLVGRSTNGTSTVVAAYSKGRLPGDLASTASAAADGNPATAWQPGFGSTYQVGQWLEYDLSKPITFSTMNLQVVADGRHSVPTAITVSTESGSRQLTLPTITDGTTPGSTVTVPLRFAPLTGAHVRVTITGVRFETSTNFYSADPIALPLGIAEVGIPGIAVNPVPATLPGTCQSNLISIDGQPISVAIVGSSATALQDGEVDVVPCGPDANGITLSAGSHVLLTAPGHSTTTGWQIDQLALDSAPGGGPAPAASFGSLAATQPGPMASVTVTRSSATSEQLTVTGATRPFELVLGESLNSGWKAVATPTSLAPSGSHSLNLGPSQLVDAFANGWPVTAADLQELGAAGTGQFTVTLQWTPQHTVDLALVISAIALALCIVLALWPLRRVIIRRRRKVAAALESEGPAALVEPAAQPAVTSAPLADHPVLTLPTTDSGPTPKVWVIVTLSILIGLIVGAISYPRIGLAVALAVAAALTLRWLRGLLTFGALGCVVAAVVIVVLHTGSVAPVQANWLVWLALGLLGADAVVVTTRNWERRARGGLPPADTGEPPAG